MKAEKLEELAKQISSCQYCPLYKSATQAVPGEGNPEAKIIFIGEGPGYWEDRKGIPFCGPSGELLDELLKLINLKRKDVFIGNVVKHRPPENRDPLPLEIEACKIWLDKQIETINPEIIVTLGRFSLNKFLPGEFISRVHGQPRCVNFAGKKRIIVPMYHPAAALRGETVMMAIREDFQKIPALLRQPESIEETGKSEESNEQLNLIS